MVDEKYFDCSARLAAYLILKNQKIIDIYKTKSGSWRFKFLNTDRVRDLLWQYKHIVKDEFEE